MFPIEKNVPRTDRKGDGKFPFTHMEVGDSFAVPKSEKASKYIGSYARSWSVQRGVPDRKYSIRTNGEAVRIWRIA